MLLLASGARRGEIHALDHTRFIKSEGGDVWWLKPNPGFMAKNFNPRTGKGKFEGFRITKLTKLSKDPTCDEMLCPVRALRWYLHRSSSRRNSIKQLFITCDTSVESRPIHKNTLSAWTKKVIADAYHTTPSGSKSLLHRSTHEIRGIAASFALYGNTNLEDILSTCRWASASTFTKFYLKDISGVCEGVNSLLPLQAAGGGLSMSC